MNGKKLYHTCGVDPRLSCMRCSHSQQTWSIGLSVHFHLLLGMVYLFQTFTLTKFSFNLQWVNSVYTTILVMSGHYFDNCL